MKWRSLAIHFITGTLTTIIVAWACVLVDAFEWQRPRARPVPISPPTQSGENLPTDLSQLPEVIISDVSTTVTVAHTSGSLVQRPGWIGLGSNAFFATEELSRRRLIRLHSQWFGFGDGPDVHGIAIDLDTWESGWPFRCMSFTTCAGGGLYLTKLPDDPDVQTYLEPLEQAGKFHQPLTIQSNWFGFLGLDSTQNFPLRPILVPFLANTLIFAALSALLAAITRTLTRWFFHSHRGLCGSCGYDAKGLSVCPECSHPLAPTRLVASEIVIPLSSTH